MMKILIELILIVLLIVFVISQIVIPSFTNSRFFWLFRKEPIVEKETTGTLGELAKETKTTVKQYEKTKNKIEAVDKQLQNIKSQIK